MIRTRPLKRTLDCALEATPAAVPEARRAVRRVAASNGACEDDLDRIGLAVSEAVTNAIVHAYAQARAGAIQLTAVAVEDELSVLVADDGCGLGWAPASPGLGLGMGVIECSADALTITTRASGGTLLEMLFRLRPGAPDGGRPQAAAQLRGSASSAICPA